MITLEWMEARAIETGQPVGVQIQGHLLAAIWVDGALLWTLDGEMLHPDEVRLILKNYT